MVYGLVTIGAPLMAHGILMWFLSSTIGWQYYAQVNPQWVPTFLPAVPTWFSPTDAVSVDGFFQGRTTVPAGSKAKARPNTQLSAGLVLITRLFPDCRPKYTAQSPGSDLHYTLWCGRPSTQSRRSGIHNLYLRLWICCLLSASARSSPRT